MIPHLGRSSWLVVLALTLAACEDAGVALAPDAGMADGAPADLRLDGVTGDTGPGPDLSTATTITGVAAVFTLAPANTLAYGLAHDDKATPHRLYVSDYNDHKVYVYGVGAKALALRAGESFSTSALHKDFVAPRGLALAREGGRRLLFAVTSSDTDKDGLFHSRLWRVDLDKGTVDYLDLVQNVMGLSGAEAFGLAHRGGRLLVSYDTSKLKGVAQVRRGILRLRVSEGAAPDNWWTRAKNGDKAAVEAHLPHSGRKVTSGYYPRAPSFGLAAGAVEGAEILWGTSYHKYLYAADGKTGRGLFHWWSPGARAIYGLAFGDRHLWAVDRISGADRVYKIRTDGAWTAPLSGTRHVRHLLMEIASSANVAQNNAGVRHNFASVHTSKMRPSQGDDPSGATVITKGAAAKAQLLTYLPAGDASSTQRYRSAVFTGAVTPGQDLKTSVNQDFWTSSRRLFVYPHKVDTKAPPPAGYTADCSTVYKKTDKAAYSAFWGAVQQAMSAEYGLAAAASASPYWRARNIMELILERHDYGNVNNPLNGHFTYNPANLKLKLALDDVKGNEKMSCSTSTFAMAGVLRYLGIPARWIGTTKRRGGWDANKDGYLGKGEGAVDTSFHRWPEVWLGKTYGWQRFDPTPPGDGPRELSQYELMAKSAQGVGWTDLVLQVGSGKHEPFLRQKDGNQRYNSVPRYDEPLSWTDTRYRKITWGAACYLQITAPSGGTVKTSTPTVTWSAWGRWDMDTKATVSLYRQELDSSGKKVGSLVLVAGKLPYKTGSHKASMAGVKSGTYHRFEVRKDGDSETGARGKAFTYSP